jgi:nitrogen fixation NifU-like protein
MPVPELLYNEAGSVPRVFSEKEMEASLEELKKRLRAVYSDITVDHIIHPRNSESLPNPDGFAVFDSGCGESMKIWLRVRDNVVVESGFWTNGCAATIACGSMSTELILGKSIIQALAITAQDIAEALVDLPPGNFHCAELAANTLRIALKDYLQIQQQPWKRLYRK